MRKIATNILVCSLLAACSTAPLEPVPNPSSSKLRQAIDLYTKENQPQQAEALFAELLNIYQQSNNPHGLGHVYRGYGDLLTSTAVDLQETFYRKNGFMDRSTTFDNRFLKAKDNYREALRYYEIAEKREIHAGQYDGLTNLYMSMAWSSSKLQLTEVACSYHHKAMWAYEENLRNNPGVTPYSRTGTVREAIESASQQAGCV